ncbi:MAG TPA: Rrf2 family transcriptional regulator [Phnomibacter sp.]|nr:Rrf2 family transcriptional regulator [Phnomibacter sp.]
MLSQKTKYALQALSRLAANYGKGPTLIPTIAVEKGIPLRFLENILHQLKNEGLLISHRGRNGGYELAKHPSRIKLATIIRLVDGPIAMLSCVSLHFYEPCEGCNEKHCGLKNVMAEARDAILAVVEKKTLADIMDY